eukprot:1149103-Pelagomonas_calceolata.AAC.2
MLPRHSWKLQIIAVWNTAARVHLKETNPTWLTDLARDIPEARWWKTTISNDPVLNPRHPGIETGFKKFEKLPSHQQHSPKNIVQSQEPGGPSCRLPRLAQSWSEKARIGKNGHTQMEAAKYTLEDKATLTSDVRVATNSLSSLFQFRKQTLYPELHHQHVKSHAGIAGNECADAIAKHQAIQGDDTPADIAFPCVNLEDNPFHDTTWLDFEKATRSHASTSERPNPPTPKLKNFSNLHDALRTHMHSKHRLGNANTETGYYSYYQSLLPIVHKK